MGASRPAEAVQGVRGDGFLEVRHLRRAGLPVASPAEDEMQGLCGAWKATVSAMCGVRLGREDQLHRVETGTRRRQGVYIRELSFY